MRPDYQSAYGELFNLPVSKQLFSFTRIASGVILIVVGIYIGITNF